jgi:hypothetical protein
VILTAAYPRIEPFERGQQFSAGGCNYVILERLTPTTFRVIEWRWWHFFWLPP